jgi:hypothetical protein
MRSPSSLIPRGDRPVRHRPRWPEPGQPDWVARRVKRLPANWALPNTAVAAMTRMKAGGYPERRSSNVPRLARPGRTKR